MQKTLEVSESNDDVNIRSTRYEFVNSDGNTIKLYGNDVYEIDHRLLNVYNENDKCVLDYFDNGYKQLMNFHTDDEELKHNLIKEFNLKHSSIKN